MLRFNRYTVTLLNGLNMILKFSVVVAFIPYLSALPENSTVAPTVKQKRAPSPLTYGYGNQNPVFYYLENTQPAQRPEIQPSATSVGPANLYPNLQQPLQVYGGQAGVNNKQLLYNIKQSPTNLHPKKFNFKPSVEVTTPSSFYINPAVSSNNIQPLTSIRPAAPILQAQLPHVAYRPKPQALGLVPGPPGPRHAATSATIVNPVQHVFYTNHNPQNAQFNPVLQVQNAQASGDPALTFFADFTKTQNNPNPVIPETKLTPHSIYYKRKYHNQQKLPLINFAQPQNGNGVIITQAHLPANGANLPPITKNTGQETDQPAEGDEEEEEEEEEEEDQGEEKKAEEEEEEEEGQETEGEEEESDNEEKPEKKETEEEEEEESESQEENEEDENKMDEKFLYGTLPFEAAVMMNEYEKNFFKPSPYIKEPEPECDKAEEDEDGRPDASGLKSVTYYKYPSITTDDFAAPSFNEYYQGFSTNSKYNFVKPGKKLKKTNRKKPFGKFKKVNYSKVKRLKPPKEGKIQGSYSHESPVTHKQKVFAQRWLLTKDIQG